MLIIFEIANNHNGSIERAFKIVDALVPIKEKYEDIDFAVKLQLRNIETFIHPNYKLRFDLPYIERFVQTKLSDEDFFNLCFYIKEKGFLLGVTPFDEDSVEFIKRCNLDFIKVASCCSNEWGLLDKISDCDKPIIVSTGGLNWDEIDNVYNFLRHKGNKFSLLHCIGIYPALMEQMNLKCIDKMKKRYPESRIGFSDHSSKGNFEPMKIAVSKGAEIIERHIDLDNNGNVYSICPEETEVYMEFLSNTLRYLGNNEKEISSIEKENLKHLKRGVWAKKNITTNEKLNLGNIFFAFPSFPEQLLSEEFNSYRKNLELWENAKQNEPIRIKSEEEDKTNLTRRYVHRAKSMLNEAGIFLNDKCKVELCHHYGFDKFLDFGAVVINVINRQYCKKFLIMFPNQHYLNHVHHSKEETFRILWGKMTLKLEEDIFELGSGDDILVDRYRAHGFWTGKEGVIFEEISTTHIVGDSYYKDTEVYKLDPMERKTAIEKL